MSATDETREREQTDDAGKGAGHRVSVVEAQVTAMRSAMLALAEMAKAAAIQCDTIILTLRVTGGQMPSMEARPFPQPPGSEPEARRRTFGQKDGAEPVRSLDDLSDAIAATSPTTGA